MKLSIEVEISPEEFPLATELLATLRSLTSHVKLKNGGTPPAAPSQATEASSASTTAAQPATSAVDSAPGGGGTFPQPTSPSANSAAAAQQNPTPSQAAPAPQDTPAITTTPTTDPVTELQGLIWSLKSEAVETVLPLILAASEDFSGEYKALLQAFTQVVFDQGLMQREENVAPYMALFSHLPDPIKEKLKAKLIRDSLSPMMVKRPLQGSLTDIYLQSEVFAHLVLLKQIPVQGATKTILQLLAKPDTRCAAVTMMGKLAEFCSQEIHNYANFEEVNKLRNAVMELEDEYKYDVNYICSCMDWGSGNEADVSSSSVATAMGFTSETPINTGADAELEHIASRAGHKGTVYAMAEDQLTQTLMSAGKDGTVLVWSPEGDVKHQVTLPHHYVHAMAVDSTRRAMFGCGQTLKPSGGGDSSSGESPSPCLLHFPLEAESGGSAGGGGGSSPWSQPPERMQPEEPRLVSCIKIMPTQDRTAFITGETGYSRSAQGGGSSEGRVCYYDYDRAGGADFRTLTPLHAYPDGGNLVTCLAAYPATPNLFLAGTRNGLIRIWDARIENSIGLLGSRSDSAPSEPAKAHSNMVTCLDASTSLLLSTSMDSTCASWDLRTLSVAGCQPVARAQMKSAALKVAIGGGEGRAAVSTIQGLFFLDFNAGESTQCPDGVSVKSAQCLQDPRRNWRYHALFWSPQRNCLYAAGDDLCIDVYAVK